MAQIALDVQNNAPQDPLLPATTHVPSSYTETLDTVRGQRLDFYSRRLMRLQIGAPRRDVLRARRIVEKAAWLPILIALSLPYSLRHEWSWDHIVC
jgi:hypothetical protein